jgi:hypothetical protein
MSLRAFLLLTALLLATIRLSQIPNLASNELTIRHLPKDLDTSSSLDLLQLVDIVLDVINSVKILGIIGGL